ncbi:MAG: AcrR family transcriptional regulator [Myxococcota bacterium]|jgi:AcrR family transcriptional regulator
MIEGNLTGTAKAKPVDGRTLRAQAKRERTRNEILDGAKQVFAEQGFHHASISDVIKAAQISRGTFYLYFQSKEAIFHELLEGFVQQLIDAVDVVDPHSEDPTGQLVANISRCVDLLFDNRFLAVVLLREGAVDADTAAMLERLQAFWLDMVAGALRNGAEAGMIRKVNEEVIATAVIGMIREVLYQYLVVDRLKVDSRTLVSASIVDFALRGLMHR